MSNLDTRVECAVVIVTYNSASDIIRVLDSLPAAAAGLTLRIIVVDNGSSDATVDLACHYANVTCVTTGANLGYAGGINVGREQAGEYSALLVLNPDVTLDRGAIREMVSALDDAEVGIVAPRLLDRQGQWFPSLRRFPTLARAVGDGLLGRRLGRRPGRLSETVWSRESYEQQHPVDWATGAALLVSAACDRAIGPWDERFFLYSEETDYAARARNAGFRIEYVPTARVFHEGGGSGQSAALVALMAISRVRYVEKHGRWPLAYRVALIVAEFLRSGDPGHRTALKMLLRKSRWLSFVEDLRDSSATESSINSSTPRIGGQADYPTALAVQDGSGNP
jgi:GT2 family glycosyltransferase